MLMANKLHKALHTHVQGRHQATILQDEMTTMRQSHGISIKRLQVLTRPLKHSKVMSKQASWLMSANVLCVY